MKPMLTTTLAALALPITLATLAGQSIAQPLTPPAVPAAAPSFQPSPEATHTQRRLRRDAARHDLAQRLATLNTWQHAQEQTCRTRFAVEGCLADIRAEAHHQRKALESELLHLNREERQDRAAERLRQIQEKLQSRPRPLPMTAETRKPTQTQAPSQPQPLPETPSP